MNRKVSITSRKISALDETLTRSRLFFSSRFARNWSFLAVSGLLTQLLGMVASIRIARLLAPQGFGLYNLVLATASLGAVVTGLGARNVIIRETARHSEQCSSLFLLSALLRLVVFGLFGTVIFFYNRSSQNGLNDVFSAVALGILLALVAWDLAESIAFGQEKMGYTAVINLTGGLIWAAGAWLAPAKWLTPVSVSIAYLLLQVSESFVYLTICIKQNDLHHSSGFPHFGILLRSLLSQSLPFYWLALLTAGITQLPVLFLSERSGQAEVAVYGIGLRLTLPIALIIGNALTALYPPLSKAFSDGKAGQFVFTVQRTLLGIVIAGAAVALGISLLRKEIVFILYGADYSRSAGALAFLCWSAVLQGIYALIGISLAASDHQRWLAALSTSYTAVALPLIWLGATYGASGLAGAILVTGVINFGYHAWVLQKKMPKPLPLPFLIRCLAILVLCVGLSFSIPQSWSWVFRASLVLISSSLLCTFGIYQILSRRTMIQTASS